MIHDKDYIIRIVKQFSEFISGLLVGKNEGFSTEEQVLFNTLMKDTFKMSFEELSSKSISEIERMISEKDNFQQLAYYELLGNLFFYHFKIISNKDFAEKSKKFYEIWLQKSQIFSISIIKRIEELKK